LARRQAPEAGSHESAVQVFPSLQSTGGLLHCPVAGSHTSCVHRLKSPQFFGAPWQTSEPVGEVTQVSWDVQRL